MKNNIKRIFIFIPILLSLISCGPSESVIQTAIAQTQAGWTPIPSQTNYPTLTPFATYTTAPTIFVTKLVTSIFTNTPLHTPTETNPPTTTASPTPTKDQLTFDKHDGSYMVGSEIASGIWRSSGGDPSDECWITIKTFSGDLVAIAGDLPGGTIRIPTGQYITYIGGGSGNKCTWSFLSP